MSGLPARRSKLSAAYYSPGGQQNVDSQSKLRSEDSSNGSAKLKESPPVYRRHRAGSTGQCGYEGLIFDRSPEESEKMSKKLSLLLDPKNHLANSFLDHVKGKVRSQIDIHAKKSASSNNSKASSTTIITRQLSADGSSSDSALLARHDAASDESEGELHFSIYSLVVDDPEKAYTLFMKAHRCYDVIPMNAKMVVLDTNLEVRRAFYAMVYNSVRAAILWNSAKQRLCSMLTITDFILILLRLYRTEKSSINTNLEKQLIREWRVPHCPLLGVLKKEGKQKKLTTVTANTSLYRAVRVLIDSGYHRIPVLDEENGNPLYFLTHKRILRFLYLYLEKLPKPRFMNESIRDLGIGTFKDVQFVHPETPLAQCLEILTSRHMSAVPVVERNTRVVVDIYARFDAIGLAVQQSYDNLDKTVAEALLHRKSSNWYEGVLTCLETDNFWDVVQKLVLHEVHGLVVVDSKRALRGVLTLSDVLRFMVLRPIIEHDGEAQSD